MQEEIFRTGCRFWPRRKGPFFLAAGVGQQEFELWDVGEVQGELSHLADVGFDFVRVGLPWEALQPAPQRLRSLLLNRLELLLDAAQASGLTVQLTLLGQLGGTLFLPDWLLAREPHIAPLASQRRVVSDDWISPWPLAHFYRIPSLMAGQRWLWRQIAHYFAAHPALTEIDAGGGGFLTAAPPDHPEQAFRWWEEILAEAKEPALAFLYSDTASLLMSSSTPRLHEWQATVGMLAIATDIADSDIKGQLDVKWPAFQMQLARTLAHRAVACGSVGVPTSDKGWVDEIVSIKSVLTACPLGKTIEAERASQQCIRRYAEEEQARFFSEVLPALYNLALPFICHVTWADAPPSLYTSPPYDENIRLRYAGLLRADGSEKEAATIWRRFHAETHSRPVKESRPLDIDQEEWYDRCHEPDFIPTLYQKYRHGEI